MRLSSYVNFKFVLTLFLVSNVIFCYAGDKKDPKLRADDQTSSLYTQFYLGCIQVRDKNKQTYGYGLAGRFDFFAPLDRPREVQITDPPLSYGGLVRFEFGYGRTMSDPVNAKIYNGNWFPFDISLGSALGYAINSKISVGTHYEMIHVKGYSDRAWAGSGWGFSGHYKSLLLCYAHERDGIFVGAFKPNRTFGASNFEVRVRAYKEWNIGFRYTRIKNGTNPISPEFRVMIGKGITE